MATSNDELIKRRDIVFMSPQADNDPASAAILLLSDLDGIYEACRLHDFAISVRYHLCKITTLKTCSRKWGFTWITVS